MKDEMMKELTYSFLPEWKDDDIQEVLTMLQCEARIKGIRVEIEIDYEEGNEGCNEIFIKCKGKDIVRVSLDYSDEKGNDVAVNEEGVWRYIEDGSSKVEKVNIVPRLAYRIMWMRGETWFVPEKQKKTGQNLYINKKHLVQDAILYASLLNTN